MIARFSYVLVLVLAGCAGEPPPSSCAANNCLGCCDENAQCQLGKSDVACGVAGQQCSPCSLATQCNAAGFCEARSSGPQVTRPDGGARTDAGHPDAGSAPTSPGSACAGTTTQCGSSCRDLSIDENNCGACGRECPAGLVCSQGSCQTLPADCTTSACPGDFGCNPETRRCTSGCFGNSDCRGDAVCTNGACRCAPSLLQCGNVCARTSSSTSCACPSGFEARGGDCIDVDECARGTHACPAASVCINETGFYRCECPPGFIGTAGHCEVDECATNNGGCGTHATCDDYPGSERYCQCDFGYSFDGTTCAPTCTAGAQNCVDAALACYPGSGGSGHCLRPGATAQGSLCRANQDCQRGLGCTISQVTSVGACEATCTSSCSTGFSCVGSLCRPSIDTACQPLAQDCAGSYLGCYLSSVGATCVYAGDLGEGQLCEYLNDCSVGHVCVSATAMPTEHRCRAFCDPSDPAACPAGKACAAIPGTASSACL